MKYHIFNIDNGLRLYKRCFDTIILFFLFFYKMDHPNAKQVNHPNEISHNMLAVANDDIRHVSVLLPWISQQLNSNPPYQIHFTPPPQKISKSQKVNFFQKIFFRDNTRSRRFMHF